MYSTEITDNGLAHLSKLTNFEKLDLKYCNKITDVGVINLKKFLKNLVININ